MGVMRREPLALRILTWALIALLVVWVGFPFYWLFISSIKTPLEVSLAPPTYWPKEPIFRNYVGIWTEVTFAQALYNSFFITMVTVVTSLALTTTTGYALSRFDFKGKDFVIGLLLFVQLVPLAIYLIPLYFTLLRLKLINKYLGLIICYGIIGIPFMALIMRSYFKNAYPAELEEAAIIDGCSRFGTFLRIGLPLSRTGMIAVGTMTAINTWKEFLFASIVINKGRMRPVAVVIFDLVGEMGLAFTRMGLFMSACMLVMVPLIVTFLFVQRLIVEGLTAGSVKS